MLQVLFSFDDNNIDETANWAVKICYKEMFRDNLSVSPSRVKKSKNNVTGIIIDIKNSNTIVATR